ncbi:MAG: OB-fold domain-containing protein [Actinomycetota bacterium]
MNDAASATDVPTQVPLVDYLVLGDEPHLQAQECMECGARYFDRRNACAACFANSFTTVTIPNEGILRSFTIVAHAAPGVKTPFVAGVVDCGGTSVRGNVINTEPDPEHVTLGMNVKLATYSLGTDDRGTEAIGFGYEPA